MTIQSFVSDKPGSSLYRLLRSRTSPGLLIPLAVLILSCLIINWHDLDRRIAAQFFNSDLGWLHRQDIWVQLFYRFGNWPALHVGVAALAVLALSPFYSFIRRYSRLALFLLLLLALGPGLIVNSMFKQHFGRPRPIQVVEFGGKQQFVPVLMPNFGEEGHSFPSGHASMGFYWIGLFVYWWKTCRWKSLICLAIGLAHGGFMGTGRMLQGAHWFSDVVWSAGFVYLTAWCICRLDWFQTQADGAKAAAVQKRLDRVFDPSTVGPDAVSASKSA
jgi:membrane-associated PAP2 superfamily phosphatase